MTRRRPDVDAILTVSQQQHEQYPRSYRNLMLIAYLGARYGVGEDTDIACTAVEGTLQDATRFHIELALVGGMAGHSGRAVALMGARLQRDPDDELSKIVLGVAKRLAGDPDWRDSIDNVLACSLSQKFRQAALNALANL